MKTKQVTDSEQRLIDAGIAFGDAVKASRESRTTDPGEATRLAVALYEAQRELHTAAKLLAAERRK